MRFRKIRIAGEEVELAWVTKDHGGADIASTLISKDGPMPEFTAALEAFKGPLVDLLELPESYESDLTVTSLSISESRDSRGLVVSAVKRVAGANAPFNIHSPILKSKKEEGQPDGAGLITDDMEAALAKAEKEAERFLKGARAQRELELVGSAG